MSQDSQLGHFISLMIYILMNYRLILFYSQIFTGGFIFRQTIYSALFTDQGNLISMRKKGRAINRRIHLRQNRVHRDEYLQKTISLPMLTQFFPSQKMSEISLKKSCTDGVARAVWYLNGCYLQQSPNFSSLLVLTQTKSYFPSLS